MAAVKPVSRYEKAGGAVEMPPVVYGQDLIETLWAVGPVTPEGHPVPWQELRAYAATTRRRLTRWEAETVRKMSEAYAITAIDARREDSKAPWSVVKLTQKSLNNKILDIFGPLFAKPAAPTKPVAQKIPRQKPDGRRPRRDKVPD